MSILHLFFIFLIIFLLFWQIWTLSYWIRKGIPGPTPLPIIGNILDSFLGRKTLGEVVFDIYKKYEKYPFIGFFRMTKPCLLVRDPELVHRIFVKDFNSFRHNEFVVNKDVDPLLGRNPFVLRDQEWKNTRQMLSPGYSSGRMKNLHPIFLDNARQLVDFIKNHPAISDAAGLDTRKLCKQFTLNNVAKSAFGIDGECFKSYEKLSNFMDVAEDFLVPGTLQSYLIVFFQIFPGLLKIFPLKLINANTEKKLIDIISNVINHRKTNNVVSYDYLQFLINLAKEHKLTDVEVTAHASTFFFDGYASSALVMSHALLCLVLNPKYQVILREEIQKTEQENDGQITYDVLQNMPWLNACFYESMRLLPLADILARVCSERFEYTSTTPGFENLTVTLNPGDTVIVPYSFFGKDSKYFDEPEKFKPERMLGNKDNSKMYFYPFTDGPRNCIGQRLGLLQIKVGLCEIMKNFDMQPSPKLEQPITFLPYNLLNEVKGGVWCKFKKI